MTDRFPINRRIKNPAAIRTRPTIIPKMKSLLYLLNSNPNDKKDFLSINLRKIHAVPSMPINPNSVMVILAGNPRSLIISLELVANAEKSYPNIAARSIIAIKVKIADATRAAIRNSKARSQPYLIKGVDADFTVASSFIIPSPGLNFCIYSKPYI
jgi:hypothetical protein